MTTISALELIRAHRWSRLFFTTYSLSLSFFESVVLDAIVRQEIGATTVLADVVGIRAAMEEYGAQAAGRLYDVEPVVVKDGCFHPKMLALTSESDAHLMIGSGNLTFGGWGSNLECLEHLHPTFAADAFEDAAGFLRSLAEVERVSHDSSEGCIDLARSLTRSAAGQSHSGQIRLVHSLGASILDQLTGFAEDLGGAKRLVVVSPFFAGNAIDLICSRLGLNHAHVHAHDGGIVAGTAGSNWPAEATTRVFPVMLDSLRESKCSTIASKRRRSWTEHPL